MNVKFGKITLNLLHFFVADGINSVGDYNSSPGGCRLSVCVSVCLCVCVSQISADRTNGYEDEDESFN